MKRRINYTGRKRIDHARAQLELIEQPGKPMKFAGHIDLSGLDLPGNAKVFIEAYHKESTQRFECGTVNDFRLPEETSLSDVDEAGSYLFRVKVVDKDNSESKLLASAERIQPKEPGEPEGNKDFLIKLVTRKDTNGVPWKVEMELDGNVKPVLVLNNNIPGFREKLRKSAVFRGLILPAVIREVLSFIFLNGENLEEDENSWQAKWLRFAAEVTAGDKEQPTDQDSVQDWISDVVAGFSTRNLLCEKLALAEEIPDA